MNWNYDTTPEATGWYAILICREPREGFFPEGGWWNGNDWTVKDVVAFGDLCDSYDAARKLAYQNDIEVKMNDDTNEDPGYDPTLCKCGEDANPPHMCPHKAEIVGDYETLCNCCDECTNQCGYDI